MVGPCSGDSGGPLACESTDINSDDLVLIGVVSGGDDCGQEYSPG